MLKLESLLTFVATAETSSISEAARRLQISKSVASERLAELERSIGATLMRRSTRKLMLTEDGIAFLERAKRIVREVIDAIIMRDSALQGLGIALLTTFVFHECVTSGRLRMLDVGAEAEPATIFIGYPNDRRVSAKVLALIAHLRTAFGTPPYWER